MVQIITPQERQSFSSQLGGTIGGGLGQGLASGVERNIQNRMKKEAEEAAYLRDLGKLKFQGDIQSGLQREKYGFEKDIKGTQLNPMKFKEALLNFGFSEEEADQYSSLYNLATEGGKTQILSNITDVLKRKEAKGRREVDNKSINTSMGEIDLEYPSIEDKNFGTEYERERRSSQREKSNIPTYEKLISSTGTQEEVSRYLERLEQLSPHMPTGLQKWNIDPKTGELRIPALAGPEVELYSKTINDFIRFAKDFFPGRVTNFDLGAFMRRLPNLSNSAEGRDLIIKQMQLSNQLSNLKDDLRLKSYEHYGLDKPKNEIEKIAANQYKRLKKDLESKLKNLDGMLDDLDKNPQIDIEQEFQQVQPGTPITQDIAFKFLSQAKGDREKAEQMAKEAGYEF